MALSEDDKALEDGLQETSGLLLALLLSIPGAIALVWLAVDFRDRIDQPNYWTRASVTVPIALILLAGAAWVIRRTQVDRPAPSPSTPPSDWWWPFYSQSAAVIFLVGLWRDRSNWNSSVADILTTIVGAVMCGFLLLLTRDGVRRWRERPLHAESTRGDTTTHVFLILGFVAAARDFSGSSLLLGGALAAIAALPLAGYMYTNRRPRLPRTSPEI